MFGNWRGEQIVVLNNTNRSNTISRSVSTYKHTPHLTIEPTQSMTDTIDKENVTMNFYMLQTFLPRVALNWLLDRNSTELAKPTEQSSRYVHSQNQHQKRFRILIQQIVFLPAYFGFRSSAIVFFDCETVSNFESVSTVIV